MKKYNEPNDEIYYTITDCIKDNDGDMIVFVDGHNRSPGTIFDKHNKFVGVYNRVTNIAYNTTITFTGSINRYDESMMINEGFRISFEDHTLIEKRTKDNEE